MIDLGTKCKIAAKCGLARGNLQRPQVLDWFGKPKTLRFNFLVDLKVQHMHRGKNIGLQKCFVTL